MCDEFGPKTSRGAHGTDSDSGFEVAWHPHHGMDILSYFVAGNGRHADSLGNREIFRSPGFQWLSVGSGIEHAEGGGTPEGELEHGFQIWLRMPTAKMRDAPRYGPRAASSDESRRRRGRDVDRETGTRRRRGRDVDSPRRLARGGAAAATWIVRGD